MMLILCISFNTVKGDSQNAITGRDSLIIIFKGPTWQPENIGISGLFKNSSKSNIESFQEADKMTDNQIHFLIVENELIRPTAFNGIFTVGFTSNSEWSRVNLEFPDRNSSYKGNASKRITVTNCQFL